jgi:hypothetical protein
MATTERGVIIYSHVIIACALGLAIVVVIIKLL